MDLSWVFRARWRLVGAWMWPAFVVLAVADGLIGHALPVAGGSESLVGGIILGLVCNLIVVAGLAWPLAWLLRRRRRDLPLAIARNYAGTAGVVLVTLGLSAIGVSNRATIRANQATMHDADARAAAWIGDHAPAAFRADADQLTVFVIQAGDLYRACASNSAGTRDYCVVVDERRGSVVPAGSESNQSIERGFN